MQIDTIDSLEAFSALKENWDTVYEADPEAQLFLSWAWLSRWLVQLEGPWFILAARSETDSKHRYVAFFPMRLRIKMDKSGTFFNELNMAGNYAADYTGLICRNEFQDRAIAAFARHLRQMRWTRIHFENLSISEQRARLLLAHFPMKLFRTDEIEHIGKLDKINNCICPSALLAPDWESYLEGLSTNTRQKIRRFLRKVETSSDYRISQATPESIEYDLDILLRFWKTKWGARKGNRADSIIRSNREMLLRCFESGLLMVPILWSADKPVCVLAILRDVSKRSLLFYMAGRDETFEDLPSGLVLHAHTIRNAIANGFTRYDFLRGNEPYKYAFNVEERRIRCVKVSTRTGRNIGGQLDKRGLPAVMQRVTRLHQAGHIAQAERGYRQVLETEPAHCDALYRFGQLKAGTGDHLAARRLFRQLVAVRPTAPKAWLWLAKSCQSLGRREEATNAVLEAKRLTQPGSEIPKKFRGPLAELATGRKSMRDLREGPSLVPLR